MLLECVVLFPVIAFLALLLSGADLSRRIVSVIGVGGIALSAVAALACAFQMGPSLQQGTSLSFVYWTWIPFYGSAPDLSTVQFGFTLDALSLTMICLVSFVASLIALFSVQFMEDEDDTARFFASMNLFVASMLVLVLADNLLLLLLGWEGVGLCSYLLIGFWYQNSATGKAATKAFLTTRIGDVGLLVAILFVASSLGTLQIQETLTLATTQWHKDAFLPTAVAFCLLFAATGKSAQLPLQVWLPDAMLGPTPVSALIHAATMVTAGVYLIARLSPLFALSSVAHLAVLVVGAVTLLIAGFSALAQNDLKRVLAYSTMSQIGYMFLALGAGAYSAAMFHLVTHAFFKALLFLSAGVIGYSAHHEYDMFKLGGLRKTLPVAYYSFLVGALCLSALPLVTSGFYSKEFILSDVLFSVDGGTYAWFCGIVGAFITGLYTFRAFSITFLGTAKTPIAHQPGLLMKLPLWVLGVFSIAIGFLQTPPVLFNIHLFDDWLHGVFGPFAGQHPSLFAEWNALLAASTLSLLGMAGGFVLFKRARPVQNFLTGGLGFDALYGATVVAPFRVISQLLRTDVFGRFAQSVAQLFFALAHGLGRLQSGRISDYAGLLALVLAVMIGFVVLR